MSQEEAGTVFNKYNLLGSLEKFLWQLAWPDKHNAHCQQVSLLFENVGEQTERRPCYQGVESSSRKNLPGSATRLHGRWASTECQGRHGGPSLQNIPRPEASTCRVKVMFKEEDASLTGD